jgi:hypothetical protein
VSEKIFAKGSKVGRLSLLQFSIHRSLSLACMTINTLSEVWHKRLGHPNSVILSRMLNSGLLGNKEHVSKHLSFDCSVCKLGRVRLFRFLLMVVVLQNALILCIVMCGSFLL